MASGTTTPRSRSRAKRSTTNLADLRLAPLSKQYEPTKGDVPPKSPLRTPYDPEEDVSFARQHSSYLQGKSAPTTPGILSRSNSRRHLGGGLSRKNSIYDSNDADYDAEGETGYAYSASANMQAFNQNRGRTEYGSGQIPKAKSEAAITAQQRAETAAQRLAGPGVPSGYFDYPITPLTTEPGFTSPEEKRGQADDDAEEDLDIEKLSGENSYGLGNLVDRIMHFNLFSVTEHVDTTDDEQSYASVENETPEESRRRMEAEAKRKKEEKDRLTAQAPPAPLGDGSKTQGEVSGWQDASWLLSVASKVIMN
ncbi:hypothetical protein HII31_13270 [Pseudocercospora fuligena]|uniref:Uncharacterized protein n=1 Tax=Pseudocercospora fuligena TaxID=685502 RepID=A0A8H6R6F2_9PEZI|nr:hypothetical protein HII31_13270 [Pseudocercospora fuligena]